MSTCPACPACRRRFSNKWPVLATRVAFDEPIVTFLCPSCTLGRTGQPAPEGMAAAGYRARVCEPIPMGTVVETERGAIEPPTRTQATEIAAGRLKAVRRAIATSDAGDTPRILHVGCREGQFVVSAKAALGCNAVGLEPWGPWAAGARRRYVDARAETVEDHCPSDAYDVIVEFGLLQHLHDPLEHLRHIRRCLTPGGVAVIEVPNLIGAVGFLADDVLRVSAPYVYTPRALASLCRRAGLAPYHLAPDPMMRIVCRPAAPQRGIVDGPDARTVADAAWGNEVRLSLKRALWQLGATNTMLDTARRIHTRCPTPASRADVAIEIGIACERAQRYALAAHWLEISVRDREDPEVRRMVAKLRLVSERQLAPTAPEPDHAPPVAARFRLAS